MHDQRIEVLLVEDNPAEARLLLEALREVADGSLHVCHAERLGEALQRVEAKSPDVVLLDLSLPDSQGLDTLERVQEAAPQQAIIVLTGNESEEVAIEAMRMGAQDYLFKGEVYDSLLIRAIYYAIERKRHQVERERLIAELQGALVQVKQLSGLLPICASCKSIRDDRGYWQQLESYLNEHSDLQFTHGICPNCARKLYPDLYAEKEKEEAAPPGKK